MNNRSLNLIVEKTNKEVSTWKIYRLANAIQGQNCTISALHNAIYICNFSNETPWISFHFFRRWFYLDLEFPWFFVFMFLVLPKTHLTSRFTYNSFKLETILETLFCKNNCQYLLKPFVAWNLQE